MLPYFYHKELDITQQQFVLNEETSKHCVQVLRMQNGEKLQLTNGLGNLVVAEIIEANKRNTIVKKLEGGNEKRKTRDVSIAISLLKNTSRFEWFLEKATEIGVTQIIPLISKRTERQNFKFDRLNGIIISAMLQSQQTFLPILHQPTNYTEIFKLLDLKTKLIAHCLKESKTSITEIATTDNTVILIGPEGDFTQDEIELALKNNFKPVTLGNTRLRTETAGIVAATLLVN